MMAAGESNVRVEGMLSSDVMRLTQKPCITDANGVVELRIKHPLDSSPLPPDFTEYVVCPHHARSARPRHMAPSTSVPPSTSK